MSKITSNSAIVETLEEHQADEKTDEDFPPFQKAFQNPSVAQKILSRITAPEDTVHCKRVCKIWNFAINNYQNEFTTLTIIADDNRNVEIKFGDQCFSLYCANARFFRKEFEAVKAFFGDELNNVKKIVIKGVRIVPHYLENLGKRLYFDDMLGEFLDSLPLLVHVVFETVCFTHTTHGLKDYEFIKYIRRLHLIDVLDYTGRILNLVGPKVHHLHLSEMMCRMNVNLMEWLSDKNIDVTIYLDDEKFMNSIIRDEERFLFVYNDLAMNVTFHVKEMEKYTKIPYYKTFRKQINLDLDKIATIKHCPDLRNLTLTKTEGDGYESEILRVIWEIRLYPKLTKLCLDGHFTPRYLEELATVSNEFKHLTHLCLKKRPCLLRMSYQYTINEMGMLRFIKNSNKSIVHVKLDDVFSDLVINMLKFAKSETLLTLEIKQRQLLLTNESLKVICTQFRNLSYLKLNGFHASMEHFMILRNSNIPKIEYHSDFGALRFVHDLRILYRNIKNFDWNISGGKVIITVSEMDMRF